MITSDLKVSEQCQLVYLKANRMLGLVKRTIHHRNPDRLVKLGLASFRVLFISVESPLQYRQSIVEASSAPIYALVQESKRFVV